MSDHPGPTGGWPAPHDPGAGPATSDGSTPEQRLAIVCFKDQRKAAFNNRRGLELEVGQHCLVEVDRGRDLGQILYLGPGKPAWWREAEHQGVLSLATAHDLARVPELRREERQAMGQARQCIADHGLDMHLVGAERRWDRRKLTFYFLAEGRVDFRALVRDLAGIFRTRIELRQIGVRDEAKLKGGLGICGRVFCCSTFLTSFSSVGLRMAKDQQLALNQAKLSGPCGRLRCCLSFEHPLYQETLRDLPRVGSFVTWQQRRGKVRKLDPLQARVTLLLTDDGQELVEVPANELDFDREVATPGAAAPEEGQTRDQQPSDNRPRRRRRRPTPGDGPERDRER